MQLYKLTEEYRVLLDEIERQEEAGIIDADAFQVALGQLKGTIEDKAENIGKFYLTLEASIAAIQAEQDRLLSRRDALLDRRLGLLDYLLRELEKAQIEKVKRDLFTISIKVNPPSVEVVDEEQIPTDYRRMIPASWQPDKRAIINHWKEKGKVLPGVNIISGKKRVEIK